MLVWATTSGSPKTINKKRSLPKSGRLTLWFMAGSALKTSVASVLRTCALQPELSTSAILMITDSNMRSWNISGSMTALRNLNSKPAELSGRIRGFIACFWPISTASMATNSKDLIVNLVMVESRSYSSKELTNGERLLRWREKFCFGWIINAYNCR